MMEYTLAELILILTGFVLGLSVTIIFLIREFTGKDADLSRGIRIFLIAGWIIYLGFFISIPLRFDLKKSREVVIPAHTVKNIGWVGMPVAKESFVPEHRETRYILVPKHHKEKVDL